MKKIFLTLIMLLVISGCAKTDYTNNLATPEQNKTPVNIYGNDNDVYRININTYNSMFPESKELYIEGVLNITEQDTSNVLKDTEKIEIRIRGNSTLEPAKKAFKIKFEKKQSLFGLEAAKDWVLLANYFDKTNVRNYLAYQLANKMSNLGFQPSSIFVDVYLNNEYQGLYMLTEQIEANKGRVDIEEYKNKNGISSFLIEADWRAPEEYYGMEGTCYFKLEEYSLKFKYPNCNKYVEALRYTDDAFLDQYEKDVKWAMTFLNLATTALKSNDFKQISKYIDIESFIDYYIVQEFFKNLDAGQISQYYIIKQEEQPKLSCGPVWDFDLSAGIVATDRYAVYDKTELWVKYNDSFYKLLFINKTFVQMLKERYTEVRPVLLEIFSEINEIKTKLGPAQNRNIEKWPLPKPGDKTYWIENYAISEEYYALESLEAHYEHLENILTQRLEILDKNYLITQ